MNVQSHRRSIRKQIPSLVIVDGSFSYDKLPSQTLKLSVLKLDSSSFYVEVAKTANVAELKKTVEAAFSYMPQKGPEKIAWPHVWGKFCLCYDGYDLVTDTDRLGDYGIKDGDQLQFVPHVSNTSFQRKRFKKAVKWKPLRRSWSQVNRNQRKEHGDDDEICLEDIETGKTHNCNAQENSSGKSRLTGFLEGLFSHTQQSVVKRARIEGKIWTSVISKGIVSSFSKVRRILSSCRRKRYIRRHPWRELFHPISTHYCFPFYLSQDGAQIGV